MKKNKLILNIGPPASGKSVFSLNYVLENDYCIRVNRDDLRFMLKNSPVTTYKIEKIINNIIYDTITDAFSSGLDVIVDNTNLRLKYINDFIKKYGDSSDIYFKIHDVDYDTLLLRDNNRDKKVGEEVLKLMYEQFLELRKTNEFIKLLDTYPSL